MNRDSGGRYESQHDVTANKVYEYMEPGEPYGAGELSRELDAPRRTIYNYLENMASQGAVRKKKLGAKRVVWIR